MRMDRRAGLLNTLKLPTLAELFADAVVVGAGGVNRSSASNAQFRFPKDTAVYLLCFHGGGYTVGKMFNPSYPEKVVQAVLTKMQQEAILSKASSSTAEQYVANTAFTGGGLYVAAHGSYNCFSISAEDSLFTPIFSYTSGSYPNKVYMYRQNNYTYLSVNGTAAATNLYGGRIARLY